MWPQGTGTPTVRPRFGASEARKTVHKINKQLRNEEQEEEEEAGEGEAEAEEDARKEQHLKCHGMKFLALRVSNKLRNA